MSVILCDRQKELQRDLKENPEDWTESLILICPDCREKLLINTDEGVKLCKNSCFRE